MENSYEYFEGDAYGTLPTAIKTGYAFIGWYTEASGGDKITENTIVSSSHTTLYARFAKFENYSSFVVQMTSSYTKTGIYSAAKKSDADEIVIDWGDGSAEAVSSVSQLVHEYSAAGTYTVRINDSVTS